MNIRLATADDVPVLIKYDKHISTEELALSIKLRRIYIAEKGGSFAGWLRYSMFWDNTPFMNMLYILGEFQNLGIGKSLTQLWENDMKSKGFDTLMTSTVSSEYAQHFYNKLGYYAIGGFTLPGDEYEIIMCKKF